jgi:hypothetical protein
MNCWMNVGELEVSKYNNSSKYDILLLNEK